MKTQLFSLDFWYRRSMASLISFSFLVRVMVGCLIVIFALQDCLEELALEELDLLELLRGRSFSFFALVLKKLKVLSIRCQLLSTIRLQYDRQFIAGQQCEKIELKPSKISDYGYLYSSKGSPFNLILPQHLHLSPLFVTVDVHLQSLEPFQFIVLGQLFIELFVGVGSQADKSLQSMVSVFLILINPQKSIINRFDQFGKGLYGDSEILFQLGEAVLLVRAVMELDQIADQVIIHEPKVGKVGAFRLLPLECVSEEVIKQLIPFFVRGISHLRCLHQLNDLQWNSLFDLFQLRLFLLLEFNRQAFLHTKRRLAVDVFKFGPLCDFFAFIEENPFALSKLFLKDKLAGDEHLASDDDAEIGRLDVKYFAILAHELVKLKNFLFDLVEKRVVLTFPYFLMTEEVPVKLLEEGEEVLPEIIQFFIHLGPEIDIVPAQTHEAVLVLSLGL